jgi:hypothetical protein
MIVAGTQLLSFGLLSRYYATVTGFLPRSPRADSLVRHVTIDRLVLVACASLIFGMSLFGYAVYSWSEMNFGPISNSSVSRAVVGGLTAVTIALQIFFSAFMLGVLNIPITRLGQGK